MSTTKTIVATAIVALFAGFPVLSQSAEAPAKKAVATVAGEADPAQSKSQGTTKSTTTRAAVKAEAKKSPSTACETGPRIDQAGTVNSTKSRADVRAEAERANKAGELPCGEQMPGVKK
jgi:ABC-type Na+ efflux pump permease subunit